MHNTIVITGCSSGIGLTLAQALNQEGYRVIATCRRPSDLDQLKQLSVIGLLLDLDDPDSVEHAAQQILLQCETGLLGLINNAGYGQYGPLTQISRQQLENQFSSNFFGLHQLTLRLLPALKRHNEGRIINLSSVLGIVAAPGRGAYSASKFALEAWSDTLRLELWGQGIFVSLIEPGPIASQFSQNVQQTNTLQPVKNPAIAAKFTLPPDAIVPKVMHALTSRSPRRRYPVTRVAQVISLAKRLLPTWVMDRILKQSAN